MERAPGLLIWPTWFQRSCLSSKSGRKFPMDSQNFPFFPPFFLVNSGWIIESSTTMHHIKLGVFLIRCRPRSNTSFYIANVAGQHPFGPFWRVGLWLKEKSREIAESKCDKQGLWKNTTMLTLKMWHVSAPRAAGLRTPTLYDFLDTFCRLCPVLTIILILVFCPSHWGIEIHNSSYYTSSASKCISSGYYTF